MLRLLFVASLISVVLSAGPNQSKASAGPHNQPKTGKMTFFDSVGLGYCGTQFDARSQLVAAVSPQWFKAANPNKDPLCRNICVMVSLKKKSAKARVTDKCQSCAAGDLQISTKAFPKLAKKVDTVKKVNWKFVRC